MLFEQLLAAAVLVPGEQHVGVHAVARAGAPQRQRVLLAVVIDEHAVAAVEHALRHGVEQLEAGTTAPAGSTSILRSPPVISLTFLPKSSAYSWKISFDGHVLCQRMVIGPLCTHDIGATVDGRAATAALVRNLRRVAVEEFLCWLISITLPRIDYSFEQSLPGLIP